MPRVVQAGGFSGLKCHCYTTGQCRGILAMVRHMQFAEGITLRSAALRLGVCASLLSRWSRRHSEIGDVAYSRKKSVCDGPLGQLKPIKNPLLRFIFEMREQGMAVSTLMVTIQASRLSAAFASKTLIARRSAVRRFLRAHSLVY